MALRRILVSWIGHADLRAMAVTLPAGQRQAILEQIKGDSPQEGDQGPIKALITSKSFDEVRLLSNYAAGWGKSFVKWLGKNAEVVQVDLKKPTDYKMIFKFADAELAAVRNRKDGDSIELCLHLSPGTPAMAAVWILLGKTRYPATFYETYQGKSWETEIPFDLSLDVIPDLLRKPDVYLQHLAEHLPSEVEGFKDICGESRAIREVVGRAKRAAIRGVNVLLLGESGTGKEMFAQAIHQASPRRNKPFISINCAVLSKTLLESELFGHVRGAFTGADKEHKGAFEQANGGTLFLDELGECDLETQAKLLRVLQPLPGQSAQTRVFRPLGAESDKTTDVRIVSATNRDLLDAVQKGQFREDLYYRLATISITLPPLRERKADVPLLAERLLALTNEQFAREEPSYQYKSLSASAKAFVKNHDWPGNVRQLHNVLVQAAVFADSKVLEKEDLIAALGELAVETKTGSGGLDRSLGDGFNLEEYLNDLQRRYLRRAMEEAKGVKTRAAKLLGINNYQTLDAQLKRLQVKGNWDH